MVALIILMDEKIDLNYCASNAFNFDTGVFDRLGESPYFRLEEWSCCGVCDTVCEGSIFAYRGRPDDDDLVKDENLIAGETEEGFLAALERATGIDLSAYRSDSSERPNNQV